MRKFLIFSFLKFAKFVRDLFSCSNSSYLLLFKPGYESFRWKIGMWKAWRVFDLASKNTPAYQKFLKHNNFSSVKISGLTPLLSEIPVTDKANYVKKYTIEDRCVGGKFPSYGVMIDESSGTSGTPNNWVRGNSERHAVKKALQVALETVVGKKQVFIINAFALGPWATGMNVSISFVDVAILKSVGPDIKKIENTLNLFGPKYEYVIMGYPPFLKNLVENSIVNWSKYNIIAVFGGEGMSEGMRDYLSKYFKKIIGSYGASDLEINIAAENDFTTSLRKLMLENEELRNKLVKVESKNLPMIFQYNPLDYYIETNEQGELIITLCRDTNISPKVISARIFFFSSFGFLPFIISVITR
jgi:phenylacetate-CoA ligase